MNSMFSFNPEEKRQRMAQALENYILPEQKVQMPQMPASGGGFSPMEIMKMIGKKKTNTAESPIDTWQGGPQ